MSAKGGITEGKSHKEGGIPMVVKSTGQQVELEGGEGVINKRNMASTKTFEFEGKEKTICEIASEINSADGNGVQIDCDNVTGKKYKYNKGGKILNEEEEQSFKEWMEDGNVHKFEDGYSTQDAQWSNRLKGLDELRRYFRKEFLSDSYNYAKGGEVEKINFEQFLDGKLSYPQVGYDENGDVLVDIIYRHNLLKKPFTHRNARLIDYAPNDKIKYPIQIKQTIYNKLFESKYAKGGWLLINSDTERIINEYDTESEAREMMYEYDGDSFVMKKSELEKEKSRETYRPPAPLNPATYIGMERGGSVDVETYDYNKLIGKYVNIYSMGVELPSEHRIEGVMFSSPQFRYRDLTLKFDRGIAPINIEDIPKFLNNDIVFVNDNKEDFGVQLIPNQFAKGGRTKNAMKLDDYENASVSMDNYEDGAMASNPTEFAKGGFVVYAENEDGYYRKISEHDTMRGAKTKMNNVFDSGEYEKVGAIPSEEWKKNYAPYQFKEGGGVDLPKANKMFHLPLELAVYVPSTQDVNKVISESELKERVDEVSEYLARLFGGFTKSDKVGGFMASNSELVTEDVVPVVSFATKEAFEANKNKLVGKLSEWAKRWGQEAIGFEFEGDLYYVPEKFAKGGIVEYVDTKRTDKNYYFLRFEDAIGSFAWIYKGKYNEGILYPLDDFDKEYYSHIVLKSGEKLYRYATERMSLLDKYSVKPFNNVRYLIKFNLDKGLIYFMSEDNDPNDDKNIQFDTRGIKADYIVIDKERFAEGGGVDSNNYRISISENDKYIGEYPNPIATITDAKVIFSQLASKYKRPQYLISVSRLPTSSSGYEILNVDEWYDYVEGFANGGDVRDMSWYQDFKKQELKRGTEHEMEHIDTIKKFKKEGVSDKEVAKAIAKDHLDENDSYYIELEKMEENAKQVNDTLSEHEKHKNRKKNIKRFRLGGYMGYRGEMIYIKMKEDVTTDLFNLEGRFYSETTFKKDALIMMSFISNNGYSTKMEIMDTGVYAIIPNVAFELVGYDSTKYGKGGDIKPQFSSVDLSENDKEILSVLRTMNEENATHEQREFISNFRGKNVVNQLSKQVISKVYGLLFEWHNIENPIHNILIENVGAGNMASLLTNSLVKKIGIEFIKDNPYYLIEKKINSIVNSSMTFYDMSSYDLKYLDAIVKVYEKTNPLNDTLVQRLYQTDKKAVAVGVAEFTSETYLNEFKNSVGINMGAFALNQMFLAKSMNYFVVNEGITDEGKHTLIYGVTKY